MRLREAVLDLVAPYDCLGCGVEEKLVCERCWGEHFKSPAASFNMPGVTNAYAVTEYKGLAKELVQAMKITCAPQAARLIARAMHECAPVLQDVIVVPVPSATVRVRERGFDHVGLIAKEFARLRGLPIVQPLVRHGKAKQAGTTRAQRQSQIAGAYQCRNPDLIMGKKILLIDDVTTSGATLSSVADVLKVAKVKQIQILVFATAQK